MTNEKELRERKMKFRPSFGLMMGELMTEREDVVFLVADSARACRFECPESAKAQLVECGISEQNMISVAAGLARGGKKPIAFAFSPFASERCFEQIRLDAAYSELNIVIVGSEGGVGMGTQGVTHYGWEDIAVMRSLPGMTVLCPADHVEMAQCLRLALTLHGPVYIRLCGGIPQTVHPEGQPLELGKAITLREGGDACILAMGTMNAVALEASRLLEAKGLRVGVLHFPTIKPLDEEAVVKAAASNRALITLEEHSVVNGLGTAVAEVIADRGCRVAFAKLGLPDSYPHTVSPYGQMLADYGLTAEAVASAVEDHLKAGTNK